MLSKYNIIQSIWLNFDYTILCVYVVKNHRGQHTNNIQYLKIFHRI